VLNFDQRQGRRRILSARRFINVLTAERLRRVVDGLKTWAILVG